MGWGDKNGEKSLIKIKKLEGGNMLDETKGVKGAEEWKVKDRNLLVVCRSIFLLNHHVSFGPQISTPWSLYVCFIQRKAERIIIISLCSLRDTVHWLCEVWIAYRCDGVFKKSVEFWIEGNCRDILLGRKFYRCCQV